MDAIERNTGSTVFASDLSIGQSQLTKLKADDGRIVSDKPELLREIERFYGQLYTSTSNCLTNLANDPRVRLTRHYTEDIPEDFSLYEIRMTLKQLKNNKAPSDDGISAVLLKAGGKPVLKALQKLLGSVVLERKTSQAWNRQSNRRTRLLFQNKTEDLSIMDTDNVLNQMAEYDFNAPIDIQMIFEDSDDDAPTFQNSLSERENINDNNNNKQDEISCENQISDRVLYKPILSVNKNNRILRKNPGTEISGNSLNNCKNAEIRSNTDYVGDYPNQNNLDANQHALALIGDDTVINNEESLPSPSQINDHHESITTFIEDVLNRLSEHIVLILQSFYHYGIKKNNEDNRKREEIFNFIKSHFFELSYTTVESIFLPREQDKSFINQFLDNTVLLANSKSLQWKCQRYHVLPFFKELLAWTKKKKEHIKHNRIPCHSNENKMLKQQLIRPLLPLNFPQSEIVANSNIATQKTQNKLCIFTSGTRGNEISINVDADTLIQINENQQCITAVEQNGSHNNDTPSCEATRRMTPVARPTYGNRVKNTKKKNAQYDRPPPPPYNMNHLSKNLPYRPHQYNQTNMNTNQAYYNNMRQPHQNHQNKGQPIASCPNQVHYNNTNQTSPSDNNNTNYLLDHNTYNNIPLHVLQMENEVTSGPVILNVTSLNPKTLMLKVRCYMCGMTISTPATPSDPYNTRRKPFYCSYLCQELDGRFYKPSPWGYT